MNQSFNNGVQFAWDSTSVKLASECMYKYKLKMIDGWQSQELSVHLRFGQVYASALEHYFKHLALGMDQADALREIILEALVATWDRTEEDPVGKPWDSIHNAKTRETLIRTIVWYVDQFANDSTSVVVLSNGKPAVELSFKLPVDNDIVLTGHLDRLVRYGDDIMVMDQKTTGSTLTARYFEGFNPDIQMSMYTFAGQSIFNTRVRGVIIDAAQIAVGFTRFERGMTFRSQGQLNEWYDNTLHTIEVARGYTREGYFPLNPQSCGNYGGCQFRGICSKSPEHRVNFLKAAYVQGPTWDPMESR